MWQKVEERCDGTNRVVLTCSRKFTPKKSKTLRRDCPPTFIELLEKLRYAIHCEIKDLTFDNLILHDFCWKVLHKVREACTPLLLELMSFLLL